MPVVLAALVLLLLQQLAWREPAPAKPGTGTGFAELLNPYLSPVSREAGFARLLNPYLSRVSIESLLDGRNSTVDAVALAGRVTDASPTYGDGVRLTIDVESADYRAAAGLVTVSLRQTSRRWRTGDRIALRSRLRRINGFGNFGELDWAAYNARRGIFVSAYAWRDDDVERLPPGDGVIDGLRRTFAESCERAGGQGAEILEALVIGDRTGISAETSVAVRDAGLAHFLAISGSHMALIVALVIGFVRGTAWLRPSLLERFDVLRAAAALAALAVVVYGAVCGGGVSVLRSELMALAAMAALWRGRPGDVMRALGGSAILLALAMPGVGEEAGFQLSYLAVSALVLDSRRHRAALATDRAAAPPADRSARRSLAVRAARVLLEAARLTIVCWLVTSPVVAHHFQRISLVAPLANLLAAPLVSAIVISGISGLALLPVAPRAGEVAVAFGSFLSELVVSLSVWCASLPHAATVTPAPGLVLTAALSSLALVALLPPSRWRTRAAAALAAICVLLVAGGTRDRYRTDRMDVWFASVGQGDAAVVRMPGGKVWVVDQGPPGRGRMVVGPLLRRAWIGRVDVLVASHVQSDHSGAMTEILEEFDVGEVWLPDGPCEGAALEAIVRKANERRVTVRYVSDASDIRDPLDSPDATIRILAPPRGAAPCTRNDQSLVLQFEFAGRRVLFTGDIEADGERGVTTAADVRADVLKVPHHGSRTSSSESFLAEVQPTLAIASLGLDNQFRFPAPEVVARYAARDVQFLRTDRTGAVHLTIASDGAIRVKTFHPLQESQRE